MRKISYFLILFVLPCLVTSQAIEEINITIRGDGYTKIIKTVVFDSEGEYATLELAKNPENIQIKDNFGDLNFDQTSDKNHVNIYFRDYEDVGKKDKVVISYGTHAITKKEEGIWSIYYMTKTTPRKTIVRLVYPAEAKVLSLKPEEILRSYVSDGIWIYPQEDSFNFTSTYQYEGVEAEPPETKNSTKEDETNQKADEILLYAIIAVLIAVVGAATIYLLKLKKRAKSLEKPGNSLIMKIAEDVIHEPDMGDGEITYNIDGAKSPQTQTKIKDSIIKILNENELRIVRLLEDSTNEEVTQAYIYKTLEIPKSSLSDILKHMETRKIIERRTEGRVKWIKLKKWVFE